MKRIINTLTTQVKKYPLPALIVFLALAGVAWFYGGAFVDGARSAFTGAAVSQTQAEAETAKQGAAEAILEANKEGVNRKVEDAIRERTIEPEVARTARASAERRARTARAEVIYEQTRKGPAGAGLSDAALRERNCADLAGLYPDAHFAFCRRE